MLPPPNMLLLLPNVPPSSQCSPSFLKKKIIQKKNNKKTKLKNGEGVREVNNEPVYIVYVHSQQWVNSVSNESQLPRPSSNTQNYTLHSSFTHQVVQTRNVKPEVAAEPVGIRIQGTQININLTSPPGRAQWHGHT